MADFNVEQGTDTQLTVGLTSSDNDQPVDLTDVSVINFYVRKTLDTTNSPILITKSVGEGITISGTPTDGTFVVAIDRSETALLSSQFGYFYEIDIEIESVLYQALAGSFTVSASLQ